MRRRDGWAYALIAVLTCALAVAAWDYALDAREPRTVQPVIQTHLIVPVPCIDALDHGDDLVSLTGEAFAAAARADDDLNDLLHRATTTTEDYKRDAARCRAHATP